MSLLPAPLVVFGQFASEQSSEWEKLEGGIGYLSGPARCVILCLLAMFLVSTAASIERFTRYLSVRRATRRFIAGTKRAFLEQDDEAVNRIAGENAKSHVVALAGAALRAHALSRAVGAGIAVRAAEWETARCESASSADLRRRLSMLATIATTAPLVGLLGTVFGILDSFRGVDMSHATAMSMLAGTLAEALISTALGIFVAVPTSWSYNCLSERSELMTIEMDVATREVQTYLAKREARSP